MSACPCTTHPAAPGADQRVAVFYLHGGGLLYGERDDLPAPYVRAFTDAGYELVCADYPLAPEAPLPRIVEAVHATWREAVGCRVAAGELDGCFLFGRSAGAYLALMLARAIARDAGPSPEGALPAPLGILDFYGYPGLTDPAFTQPARAYAKLPPVSEAEVNRIARPGDDPVTSGPKAQRYALYVHARQQPGAWLALLGLDGGAPDLTPETWSLTAGDIARLPPVFACHSAADEDVPYGVDKRFVRSCPAGVMRTVYDLPHDFDRDTVNPAGMQVYRAALAWMRATMERDGAL